MNPRLNSGRKAGDQPALTLRSPRSVVAALAPPIDVEAEPIRLLAQALQNLTHPQLNLLSRYDVQVSTPNGFPQLVYQWSTFHATLVPLANLLNMMQIDNIDRLKPFIKLTPAVTDSQQRLQFYNDFIYAFRLQNLTNASDWVGVRHKVTEFADHALDQIIKKSPEKMPVRYAYSIIEAHTFPATRQYPARNDNLRVGSIVNIGGLLYYINNRPSDFSSGVRYFDGFDDFGSLAYEAAKNRAAANKVMPHKWEAYLAFSHPQLGVSQNLLQKYEVYVDSDTVPTARIHDWPLNCSDALQQIQINKGHFLRFRDIFKDLW